LIESNAPIDEDDERIIDCDMIANFYKKWINSEPFDISHATSTAFNAICDPLTKSPGALAKKAASEIDSMCNSALTRIAPMGVYISNLLSLSDLKEAVIADVSFTHSNLVVQDACFLYCAAIHYLLNNSTVKNRM